MSRTRTSPQHSADYAVMFLVARLVRMVVDRLGMALSVVLWSASVAERRRTRRCRALGNWVSAVSALVSRGACFQGGGRALPSGSGSRAGDGDGIAIGGRALGRRRAAMTVWLSEVFGCAGVFLTTGLIGAAWVIAWWADVAGIARRSALARDDDNRAQARSTTRAPCQMPRLLSLLGALMSGASQSCGSS